MAWTDEMRVPQGESRSLVRLPWAMASVLDPFHGIPSGSSETHNCTSGTAGQLEAERQQWSETVLYELHIGAFTPEGTFRAALDKLDHLALLGVTAIEIMPVADFPGARNRGYDGALLYAPDSTYGRPDDFRALVDAAHARGISVLLDVIYNHFGPDEIISRAIFLTC